jgi:hypothetical protein
MSILESHPEMTKNKLRKYPCCEELPGLREFSGEKNHWGEEG